ncbi:MAG: AMP-binding protein [Aeromicrobium sp.]
MATDLSASQDLWDYVPEDLRIRYDELCVSIPNAVRMGGRAYGDAEAIVDGDLRLTFAELDEAMIDTVRAMMALGIGPGDRVALWAPNCGPWILAALGIQGAGGILVPVNTRFKGEEAAYILDKSGASALVVANDFLDNDYVGMLRAAAPDTRVLEPGRVVAALGEAREGEVSWADFIEAGRAVSRDDAIASIEAVTSDTVSDIMFTSGTTGHPKGVMLTHGQSLRAHGWLAKVMEYRAGDRYLIIPPFFHTFGYKAGWMACIVHGVTIVPQAVFTVDEVLRMIEQEKISILLGPPTLFQGVLDSPHRASHDLGSLRVTMASSTTVPPGLVDRMRAELGAEVTHTAYGLTEGTSLSTTTFPRIDSLEDIVTTVGRPAWDVEIKIVDDHDQEVPRGTPGELFIRGFSVMQGYWEDPEKTAEAVTPDGWLRSGDIGVMDERGFIRITDRKKDVIIVGGFNVYPAEVERILGDHPDVESIAVVGAFDERLGEVPVAFVVARPESALTSEEFLGWARDHIANFKAPRQAILIDELPRNASAKVLKSALRATLNS